MSGATSGARPEARKRRRGRREMPDAPAGHEIRHAWKSLQADLDGFVNDVVSAAKRHDLRSARLDRLRTALREARVSIVDALNGKEPDGD